MEHKYTVADTAKSEFSSVYMYLIAGIAIAIAVFLLIPKVSVG